MTMRKLGLTWTVSDDGYDVTATNADGEPAIETTLADAIEALEALWHWAETSADQDTEA
jgi:hypothetical protein